MEKQTVSVRSIGENQEVVISMSSDNPRYKAELLEDGGVNPEASGDEPTTQPPQAIDPFAVIQDTIATIKSSIDEGKMREAEDKIVFVRTMLTMGLSIAKNRNDMALKARLDAFKPQIDALEAQINL
jgi:hypothetical protein